MVVYAVEADANVAMFNEWVSMCGIMWMVLDRINVLLSLNK